MGTCYPESFKLLRMEYIEYRASEIVEYIDEQLEDFDEETKLEAYKEIVKRLNKNTNYQLI